MNWYGSFQFHEVEGCDSSILLDEVDSDALALFRRIRCRGHVYKISPDEPLANLQIASELMEQAHGPAPLRFRMPDEMLLEIRALIGERIKRPGRA